MATILRTSALLFSLQADSLIRSSLPVAPRSVPYFSSCLKVSRSSKLKLSSLSCKSPPYQHFRVFAAYGDTTEAEETAETAGKKEDLEEELSSEDGAIDGDAIGTEEKVASAVLLSLQSYKEALANNDQSNIAEIESFLQSIEDEKNSLLSKVASLAEELSVERDRVLRISADFDNFRKRTERERLSLMTNAQGEVIESLLPVLDNFERAKAQIKMETEGEEKINNSYQGIYKQFLEILASLGVETVETIGSTFDPLLHEAIMREESTEFEEGIIIQEFRKGFKLGERLLRPSMVKVSAGPGPEKATDDHVVTEENEEDESTEDGDSE